MQLVYIQILRFFAATSVALFHSLGTSKQYLPGQETLLFGAFKHGYFGVDLFFVISGFIIYYSNSQSSLSWRQFLRRRIERIVPLYWFVTIFIFVLASMLPNLFKNVEWVDLSHLLKSLFYISFTSDQMPIVYVGWSLEYEMAFYLSVGFLISPTWATWDEKLTLGFSILVILGLAITTSYFQSYFRFLTNPLLLEFIFGVLIAKLFVGRRLSRNNFIPTISCVLLLLVMDPTNRVIVAGIPAAALVFFAARYSYPRFAPFLFENMLIKLGDASYSIYLVQVFAISAANKLAVRLVPTLPLDVLITISAVTAVLAGYLVYILIERPALRFFRTIARTERDVSVSG